MRIFYIHIITISGIILHSTMLSWEAEGLLIVYHDEETRLVIQEACTPRSGSHDNLGNKPAEIAEYPAASTHSNAEKIYIYLNLITHNI